MQRIQLAAQAHLLGHEHWPQGPGGAQLPQAAADDDSVQVAALEHAFGRADQAARVASGGAEVGQSGGILQGGGHRVAGRQEDQH